jgi:hypothetical protein
VRPGLQVAFCALSCLSAILAAATDSGAASAAVAALVLHRGLMLTTGLIRCLLAPSPLPRVHKVGCAVG